MPERDRERFETIFREHYDAVLRFALARTDPETAKDAVAETFTTTWRRLEQVPEQPRAWLFAVTHRTLTDQYRGRARRAALHDRLATQYASQVTAMPDTATEVTDHALILAALARLSPSDQEVLRLVAWDDLTPAEAAQVLSCSPALFRLRLHRARRRFRTALAAEDDTAHDGAIPMDLIPFPNNAKELLS